MQTNTWTAHKAGTAAREAAVITDAFNRAAKHLTATRGAITRDVEELLRHAIKSPVTMSANN